MIYLIHVCFGGTDIASEHLSRFVMTMETQFRSSSSGLYEKSSQQIYVIVTTNDRFCYKWHIVHVCVCVCYVRLKNVLRSPQMGLFYELRSLLRPGLVG
jgi:hypothetical protein